MQKGVTCPKCQHSFAVKYRDQRGISRQPLLLKCSHTFCESCLTKLAKEEKKCITCPTCKSVTELTQGDSSVKKLPNHYYLTGYLMCSQNTLLQQELSRMTPTGMTPVKKKNGTTEKSGRLCSECRLNKATCKCLKCDCVMCGLCYDKVHSLSNSLKQHQATRITDDDNCPFEDTSPLCKLHGKPIEYFCDDDDISICSRCVIMGDHKDHSITSMEEKNRVLLGDMEPALQFATHVLKKLGKADKTLSESVPSVKSETSGVIETIKTHFQSLHAALQTRESELIEKVFAVYQDGVTPIVNMKSELVEEKRNLEHSIRAAHRIMNNNNEVILNAKDILDSLNKAKDVMCIVANSDLESDGGIRFEGGSTLLDAFKTYGSIEGEVPKRVMFHTLNSAPEDLLSDTTDTASVVSCSSLTSGTDATSTADTGEDVIIEDERDISVDDDEGTPKSKYFLKPVPGRAKMQGHCENVMVTHIRNPRQFYVQRSALNPRLVKMSKAINTWCKGLATERDIPTDVQKDDFVLCQYSGDKEWYRGRVLSVMITKETNQDDTVIKKHIEVLYFDYGNQEVVTIDKLKNMETRFMKHPEFLLECALFDIEPVDKDGMWTLEATSTMQKMIADRPMLMTVIREVGNVLEVDLHKPSTDVILDERPVSLRDSLVFLELANFITSPERPYKQGTPTHRRRDYMKPEPRQKGETFSAQITYSGVPSGFCVQPIGDEVQYLSAMDVDMQNTYSDGTYLYKIFCPQVDMICVVLNLLDGKWYRARVVDLPGCKQVDVQYVDYGNIERVSYERIRKILDTYLKLPPLAVQCELSDVEPAEGDGSWGAECLEWWTDLTTSLNFQVKILEVQVDAIEVILYRIMEETSDNLSVNYQLVANGYAKSTGSGSSVLGPSRKPPSDPPRSINYRAGRKDKQQTSSEIAVSYMTTSPVMSSGNGPRSTPSSQSSTPSHTPSVSKSATPAVTPTKNQSRQQNLNQNNLSMDVAAAQKAVANSPNKSSEVESPSEQIEIVISSFVSPANFHIQLAGLKDLPILMSNLQQQFRGSAPNQKAWKVKDFCAARHPKDNMWYRARIIDKMDDNKMKVYFVDFGFEVELTPADLRVLDIKMRALNCSAVRCHLADIVSTGSSDPLQWSATACEFMMSEIKDKTLYIKREGDVDDEERGVPIDLLIEESVAETALEPCRTSVHSLIAKMKESGLAIPSRKKRKSGDGGKSPRTAFEDQPYIECDVLHYSRHPTPQSTTLTVIPTYVDIEGIIYCQCLEDETELLTMTDEIQTSYLESPPQRVKWEAGQACIAFFKTDDMWYRALVVDVKDKEAEVRYIDYGNSEKLPLELLRIPERHYVEKPQICLECILHNLLPVSDIGRWSVEVLSYIHNIIVNHQCVLQIMKAEEGCPMEVVMMLPDGTDLGKALIQMGVATKPDDLTTEYEISRKITQVIEKRFPFKRPSLPPVDEYFPVVLTNLELPNVVWIQQVLQEACDIDQEVVQRVIQVNNDLHALVQMSSELAQTENMGKTFIKVPAAGQMCSAKFTYDDCWYRSLVIDRDEESESAHILFVDYGNTEQVSLDRLRVLTASARGLPAQAIRCQLYGLQPPGGEKEIWSKQSMSAMLGLLRDKQLLACIKTVDPLTVELYQRKWSDDLEELELAYKSLLDEGLAQMDSKLAEESELADLALTASLKEARLEDDVIVEADVGEKEMMDVGTLRE